MLLIGLYTFFPINVSAQSYGLKTAADTSGLSTNVISKTNDIPTIIGSIVGVALSLVGVYFFIIFLYAGIIYMTAAGSNEKVESAKKKMTSAVIGLVIVLSAYALVNFVFTNFLKESGVAMSGEDACKTLTDGAMCSSDSCKTNCVCKGNNCISECDYSFRDIGGKCLDITKGCDGRIFSGMCPGGANNKCCVPLEGYVSWEQSQDRTSGSIVLPQGVNEQNTCEKAGDFCTTQSSCESIYNGKAQAQGGCGTGEVCCRSCMAIGGSCIDTTVNDCTNASTNLKTGYCHGVFSATKFKCCIGQVIGR